jgi:hypothetical protein
MDYTANEESTDRGRDTEGFGCERVTRYPEVIPGSPRQWTIGGIIVHWPADGVLESQFPKSPFSDAPDLREGIYLDLEWA